MLKLGFSLIGVLILLWVAIRLYRKIKSTKLDVSPRKMLMDKLVRDFKSQLDTAVGEDYDSHPHVRLADLLVTEAARDKKAQEIKSRIESTSTDLVLTEKATGKIACVLILIHQDKLGSRQQFIRDICQQSKLPFHIFDVNNAYSDKQIRQEITMLLEPTIRLEQSPAHDIKVYLDPEEPRQQTPSSVNQPAEAVEKKQPPRQESEAKRQPRKETKPQRQEPLLRTDKSESSEQQSAISKDTRLKFSEAEQHDNVTECQSLRQRHKKQDDEPEFDLSVD